MIKIWFKSKILQATKEIYRLYQIHISKSTLKLEEHFFHKLTKV